jgi:GT2 family glycosyltransferase
MENSTTIHLVCATRSSNTDFWQKTALGISLRRMLFDQRLKFSIFCDNHDGLPVIYNHAINMAEEGSYLIFMHDDVWVDDYFLAQRVIDGLDKYDIIGVAGNSSRSDFQPAWIFPDGSLKRDSEDNLSGVVAHGEAPFGEINYFGVTPKEVVLLDGVFLAAKKNSLLKAGIFFDEKFEFNFYDLDFCRAAIDKGLKLGTWPIAITHQSCGVFGSPAWKDAYQKYLNKWGS